MTQEEIKEQIENLIRANMVANTRFDFPKIAADGIYQQNIKPLEQRVKELKEAKEAYKECFEEFIPSKDWDRANLFLSTYGSGLAKELAKKQGSKF